VQILQEKSAGIRFPCDESLAAIWCVCEEKDPIYYIRDPDHSSVTPQNYIPLIYNPSAAPPRSPALPSFLSFLSLSSPLLTTSIIVHSRGSLFATFLHTTYIHT